MLTELEIAEEVIAAQKRVGGAPDSPDKAHALDILTQWDQALIRGQGRTFAVSRASDWVEALRPFYPIFSDIPLSGTRLHEAWQGTLL